MELPPGFDLDKLQAQMAKQNVRDENAETKLELKISKYIKEMDAEVRERFMALKVMEDMIREADEEETKEIRKLEVDYEHKYKEIYAKRFELTSGKGQPDAELIAQFDKRAAQLKDEEFEKLETEPCDVKQIQNSPLGVSDFWYKALLNHPVVEISEKDRPILGYLQNIELELHDDDDGFTLVFTFEENTYFSPNVIKKAVFMKHKGIVDKLESTAIEWKDNCDPTKKKIQKKKKGKKIKQEVKIDSFFNFFKDAPEAGPTEGGDDDKEKDDDAEAEIDAEEELEEFQAEQLDMAEQIKDDLVPLALEYYLGVIDA